MQSISHLFHPHHVSLMDTDSIRAHLMAHAGDPFYGMDGLPSPRHLAAPKFDILETSDTFVLTGDLPGVTSLKDVSIDWLDAQVLVVRGQVDAGGMGGEGGGGPAANVNGHKTKGGGTATKDHSNGVVGVKKLLGERHGGGFERSFTLPVKLESGSAKVTLENGLLNIVVRKVNEGAVTTSVG